MNRYLPILLLSSLVIIFGIRLYLTPVGVRKVDDPPAVRGVFASRIKSWLVGDEGALATGILLGGSSDLSREAKFAFRRVGMSHVVAASGYNVTLMGGVILGIGKRFFGRKQLILFVVVSVILYMYLAGMSASIVRAGVMAIATYVAALLGRPADAKWTLAIVSLGMLIVNPGYIDDIGFLLSVGATWGILESNTSPYPSPIIGEGTKGRSILKIWDVFKNDLKTTLFAQLFTLPIILHYFGQLSVVSPVANAMLLWTVPITMQIMAVALGVGLIWSDLGQLVSYLAWPFLRMMNWIVGSISAWPWVAFEVAKISWAWVFAYYSLLVLLIYRNKWRSIF